MTNTHEMKLIDVIIDDEDKKGEFNPIQNIRQIPVQTSNLRSLGKCEQYYHVFLNLCLHLYFIITFEIIFYFEYISTIEKTVILQYLGKFKSYLMNIYNLQFLFDTIQNDVMKNVCNTINTEYVSRKNTELYDKCIHFIYILTFFIIFFSLIHLSIYRSLTKYFELIIINVLFICFIGLFEYIFFTNIVSEYNVITYEEAICYILNK